MGKQPLGKAAKRRIEQTRATNRRREWCACGHHKYAHEGNKHYCIVQACWCERFVQEGPTHE